MIAFPFDKEFHQADRMQQIRQSIYLILCTYPRERMMNPSFGCRIKDYVFESMTTDIEKEMSREVISSILRWEDRVQDIEVSFERKDEVLVISLTYAITGDGILQSLQIPIAAHG